MRGGEEGGGGGFSMNFRKLMQRYADIEGLTSGDSLKHLIKGQSGKVEE